MAETLAPSSTPSSSKPRVFLSFSGDDTRRGFTNFLYDALLPKGYDVFKDDISIEKGKDFSPELFKAIEASKCAVVVFSKSYASSTWCMKELAAILDCRKNRGLEVIPVFYHVKVGNLRKLKGKFVGDAFKIHREHLSSEEVEPWEKAVVALSYIAGISAKKRNESEVIGDVVELVSKSLDHLLIPTVIKDHVGIKSRINELEVYLNREHEDVRIVGIWGIGGIGKTTLAAEAFERIRHNFDVRGIIYISKEYCKHGDRCQQCMIPLQKRLFKQVLKCKEDIPTVALGATKIKYRLHSEKALIVLDNVEKPEQIEALVGKPGEQGEWFGSKSRIIVTTRNREVLKEYGDNYENIYKLKGLTKGEGLRYFYRKAFKGKQPPNDVYKKLSLKFVRYACGLPSALSTLSQGLCKKSEEQWKRQVEHLEKNPDDEICNLLRSNYDALSETNKQIFLDIALIFNGKDKRRVTNILESWKLNPANGIPALVDRSLVNIKGGKLLVNNLLKQMARHIIGEEVKAGKRSRSYHHDDALHALMESKAPLAMTYVHPDILSRESIKGLINDGRLFQKDGFNIELRMLGIHEVFEDGLEDFSNRLAQSAQDQSGGENSSKELRNETVHTPNAWDNIPSIQHKSFINETYSLLKILFEGSFASRNHFSYAFPFQVLPPWFFHYSVGNVAVSYLPPQICNDERWLGLELYVQCKQSPSDSVDDSAPKAGYLDVRLYAHGERSFHIFTRQFNIKNDSFVAYHIPRKNLPKLLNDCKGISALFMPITSDVEVKICGTRLLYEQDSESISKGIIECTFQREDHLRYVYDELVKWLDQQNVAVEQEMPQSNPTFTETNREVILNSLQELLTGAEQVAKEVSTSLHNHREEYAERQADNDLDRDLFPSKHSFSENSDNIKQDTLTSLSATPNPLHDMAETRSHPPGIEVDDECCLKKVINFFMKCVGCD